MNSLTSTMFESIKSALSKETSSNSGSKYKEIMRTEVGNTYTVRLLPNVANPSKTFFHYYSYGWNSFSTGQLLTVVSPTTWGERDPIAEERYKILRNGSEEDKKKAEALKRREHWLVNVYVVNDPTNEENNNKIKVLRFGRQLHKIIMDAIEGEEAEELGPRIFDLSPKGVNFKIKVEKQGEYPTYVSSKFTSPKEIEGLDEDNFKKIYDGIFDLESFVTLKSFDEIKETMNKHYFCNEDVEAEESNEVDAPKIEVSKKPVVKETAKPVAVGKPQEKPTADDDALNDLLKDL